MDIEVRLFGHLRRYLPGAGQIAVYLTLQKEEKVRDILCRLNIPAGGPFLILINGLAAGPDSRVQPGDRISVFPPLGGG